MPTQYILMIVTLLIFVVLGFMMTRSIKKHDAKMASMRKNKKKGSNRYMPVYKKPGK